MAIRIEHGKPSTLITAAKRAGAAKAAQRASEQAMTAATRLREKQMDMEYRAALRQQDIVIDLQMQERAKMWEIEKMELRSRGDFEREERFRQRKLDERQAKLDALEKAYDNGRGILDKESYETAVLRETTGIAFPFKRPLTEEQKFKEVMARKMREALAGTAPTGAAGAGTIRVKSPAGKVGTIPSEDLKEALASGYTIIPESTAVRPEARPKRSPAGFKYEQEIKPKPYGTVYREWL